MKGDHSTLLSLPINTNQAGGSIDDILTASDDILTVSDDMLTVSGNIWTAAKQENEWYCAIKPLARPIYDEMTLLKCQIFSEIHVHW